MPVAVFPLDRTVPRNFILRSFPRFLCMLTAHAARTRRPPEAMSSAPPGGLAHGMDPPERSTTESGAFVLAIEGRVDRAFVPLLCEWIRTALASCAGSVVICDVANVVEPSAATVEALARAQLTALRAGGLVRLRGAG